MQIVSIFIFLDNSLNETLLLPPTSRRQRSSFTIEQTQVLEQYFLQAPYPDAVTREYLVQQLNVDENRLQTWFSNRRARTKKSTTSPINNENQLPMPMTSSDTDIIKPYPFNEPAFDGISTCK